MPYDLLVRLASFTGLRLREVAGLRIRDIDMRAGEVQVRLNRTHSSNGHATGELKNRASRRDVPILDDQLLHDLGMHVRNQSHRADLEAGLWPGKVRGHARISYDRPLTPRASTGATSDPRASAPVWAS